MPDDPDTREPANQDFIEEHWRAAAAASREAMDHLRAILPEMATQLAEIDEGHLTSAEGSLENAYSRILKAGKGVLGRDEFDQYLAAQTERKRRG